jgi:transcriptional regulator with XRE-family HTH domain
MIKYKNMGLINVKKYMKEAGLQSKEVADRMGVRAETISRWVSGTNNPGLEQVEELADILGVSISDILFKQKGMLIAGTRDFHGNVTFYNTMDKKRYMPILGMDVPEHRFCLELETHRQEDKHSYETFSNVHILKKIVSTSCYTMRSLVKITHGPQEFINKIIQGIVFPMPTKELLKGKLFYNIQRPETKDIITNVELEWATPLISRFYNRNHSEILDLSNVNNLNIDL